jgi:hypothetical protein
MTDQHGQQRVPGRRLPISSTQRTHMYIGVQGRQRMHSSVCMQVWRISVTRNVWQESARLTQNTCHCCKSHLSLLRTRAHAILAAFVLFN